MALADIKLDQAKRKALEQRIKEDASRAQREQDDGAPGAPAGTAIDTRSWRIAIRQADMLIRRKRDRVKEAGRRGSRVRKRESEIAAVLTALADELWHELNWPPATVQDAYKWDELICERWHDEPELEPVHAGGGS